MARSFHEKAGFVKAAVAGPLRRIRDLRQPFCLASIRTLVESLSDSVHVEVHLKGGAAISTSIWLTIEGRAAVTELGFLIDHRIWKTLKLGCECCE